LPTMTLIIGLLGFFAMLALPPRKGLVAYLAILCGYAAWAPAPLGGINLTAPRIVIMGLLLRCMLDPAIMKRYRWNAVDLAVIAVTLCQIGAGMATSEWDVIVQNRAGAFFDTAGLYFVARFLVRSSDDFLHLCKWLLVIAAPLAVLGVLQSTTGFNPWGSLTLRGDLSHATPTPWEIENMRYGLYRARVNFYTAIVFGFFFFLVAACGASLWRTVKRRQRPLVAVGLAFALVGIMSSLSTGALMGAAFAGPLIVGYPFRRHWKIGLGVVITAIVAVDILSNRAWYEVAASYLTFNEATALYRIGLVKEAFSTGMAGHWVFGYGLQAGFETIQTSAVNWEHTDITNHYIFELILFGLVGLVPWIIMVGLAIRRLVVAWRRAHSAALRWVLWCVGATMTGVIASMMSACWEGQAYTLFYMVLAVCANAPLLARVDAARHQAAPRPAAGPPASRRKQIAHG